MRFSIPIVMMLCLPATADTPKPAPGPPVQVKERLELTAKVAEIPRQFTICGRAAVRAVVRFEVISVEKGTWPDKNLYAVQLCPEVIKVGDKLRLVLEKPTASDQGYTDTFPKTSQRWVIRDSKRI